MKILYVIKSLDPKDGGIVRSVTDLTRQHKSEGVDVSIVCLDSPESDFVISTLSFVKIYALGQTSSLFGYSKVLTKWLSSNISDYDAVVLNGLWQYPGLIASRLAIKHKIPYFIFTHGMLDCWFKRNHPFKHLKKLAYWFLFERKTLKMAFNVLYTSPLEEGASKATFPFYIANSAILPLGTTSPSIPTQSNISFFLKKFDIPSDKILILFLSRIHEKKGCDILLRAFAEVKRSFPNIHLLFAGPGDNEYINYLKGLADTLALSLDITWTGMLSGIEKLSAFKVSSVFALPSHQENFCIAVAEALSFSLPVLISNKINIYNEIDRYNCGFVSNDDLNGTYSNLIRWLSLSHTEMAYMKSNALRCFEENFRIEITERRLVEIIQSSL